MKKTLLTLVVAAGALAAHAFGPAPRVALVSDGTFCCGPVVAAETTLTPAKAPARVNGSMYYTFAQEPYSALGSDGQKAGDTQGMALQFTPAEATKFAGSKIKSFSFYTGTAHDNANNSIGNLITKATIFITDDLQKDPVYTQEVSGMDNTPFKQYTFDLTTPYTIEAGKGFYIGVLFTIVTDRDLAIVVDYNVTSTVYGGWAAIMSKGKLTWLNTAQSYGSTCIGATIEGNLPENDLSADDYYIDCVVEAGKDFSMDILVTNNASNDINTIDFTANVGGNTESNTMTLSEPLPYKASTVLTLTGLKYDTASGTPVPVSVSLDKVNGQANNSNANTVSGEVIVIPAGKGYVRNVVIEEMTGNWCGYCPTGMVTMEAIREKYTDGSLIPVAIHVKPQNGREPMYASTWANVASLGGGSVPSAILNRMMITYPQYLDYVIDGYNTIHAIPALAGVTATARFSEENPRQIIIDSKTAFVFDMTDADSNFRLCYGITEDNVGPYTQTNYYAGENVDAGGWEDLPSEVEGVYYNDVARQLLNYRGIVGSIPAEVKAGVENDYSYTVTLNTNVKPENANVIVYLINTKSGIVENAWYIPSSKISSGVEDIFTDDTDAPTEVYNLSGVKVGDSTEGLAAGIYIVRKGNKATKVAIR